MGVLNITPDSFSDGGLYFNDINRAVSYVKQMIEEGVDMLDVGGESTRPNSEPVSEKEELRRVLPIIERLRKEIDIPLSIDTYKPRVAAACLERGATLINDITGMTNQDMLAVAAQYQAPVVIMHMQGGPKTMQVNPHYDDVVTDVKKFFTNRIIAARNMGIKDLILDPGIGFGKTTEHNLSILARLDELTELGYPVLVGPSRKSFISEINGLPLTERLEGTIAAVVAASLKGARLVRVHDIRACKRALSIVDAIKAAH